MAFQSTVLWGAVLAAYGVIAPVAYWVGGADGLLAAATAGTLCLLGSETALLVARCFQRPTNLWQGVVLGMFPRMGIPLCAALTLQLLGGPLAQSCLLVYLIVFYQVTLATEALLCLPPPDLVPRKKNAPRDVLL